MPEVHSVYVPVKSLGSISGSASTALSFNLLSSATVGSAYTNTKVNVHRSAHPHTHAHTQTGSSLGACFRSKRCTRTQTHTHTQVDITTSIWIGNRHSQPHRRLAGGTLLEALLAHEGISLPVLPPDCGDAFLDESNPSSCGKGDRGIR